MLHNYFHLAWRHLSRSKVYTVIHIAGLTVGFVTFFLIAQYLVFELSFDRFNRNFEKVFRVTYEQSDDQQVSKSSAGTFFGVGNMLRDNFPEVEAVVRFYKWPANTGAVLMANKKIFNERNYFFAESTFFRVFPSLLLEGNMFSCLSEPKSIVISQRLAMKMFGTTDALGKTVSRLDVTDGELMVTGIMINPPANSNIDADVIIPYDKDWLPDEKGNWLFPNNLTYISLKDGVDATSLAGRLNKAVFKSQAENAEVKGSLTVFQPLSDVHFSSYQTEEIKANGSKEVVYGIGISGIIILFMAWINYVNLEVSRFLTRMREVGIRRIIGSTRWQLFLQVFMQYVCLTCLAVLLSGVIIYFVGPYFTNLTGAVFLPLSLSVIWPWAVAAGLFIIGSLVVGVYPSYFIIRLNPVSSIRGKLVNTRATTVRRVLLTAQLAASLGLLSFLFVVFTQLDFMRMLSKKAELNRVLTVYNSTSYSTYEDSLKKENSLAFRNRLLSQPVFVNVSVSSTIPGEPIGFTYHNLTKRTLTDPDDNVPYKVLFVDYYFIPVYQLPLLAGRNYSPESGEDNNLNSIIINKSAALALGFGSVEAAIDKEINFMVTFDWKKYRIIGIVDDYRHESVKSPVYPTIFFLHKYVGQMVYYSILIDDQADANDAFKKAEESWRAIWPEKPFDYFFADNHYDLQFKAEVQLKSMATVFAFIAMGLACLGTLGLTLFEANSRLREISIRKVLGASVKSLIGLLTRDNFLLLAFATILSGPIVYFLASNWLSYYPVRIDFSWQFVVLPVVILFFVVGVTAVTQTIRAAYSNPVDHLKHE